MSGEAIIEQGVVPLANAGPDKWIELSGQITLEGSISGNESAQFIWNPAAKLLNPEALQPTTIVLDQTTLFSLEASSPGCGSSQDFTTVFVTGGELSLEIYSSPASCPGSEISLYALPGGGAGNYSYQWTSIPEGFESTVINPLAYPEEPSWYILELTDGFQSIRDSVFIAPLPQSIVFEVSGGGSFCADEASLSFCCLDQNWMLFIHYITMVWKQPVASWVQVLNCVLKWIWVREIIRFLLNFRVRSVNVK